MLNFRNTNIFFAVLLFCMLVVNRYYPFSKFFYLIPLLAYSLVLFYGSYSIQSGFYIPVPCAAKTQDKRISISFDDGPDPQFTPEILALLEKTGIKAAFFCIGKRIEGNELLLRRINENGHLIGNHSYSHHFWFDLFSAGKMYADLRQMDHITKEITGLTPRLFRPPYGVTNPNLKKAILRGNYIPVGWSIRSMDTVIRDEKKLLHNITKALKPGAIILFHDTSRTTVAILPAFISYVKAQGYEIIRLDKLLNLEAYV
jgi:peptidoglycan-N-acetylglucosamine deacetylase